MTGPDRQRLEGQDFFVAENRINVGEFFFNHRDGLPTADVAVRQALMRSLDLIELMTVQTSGTGELGDGSRRAAAQGLSRRHRR